MLEPMNPDRTQRHRSRYYRPRPHTNSFTNPAGGYKSRRVRPEKETLLQKFRRLLKRP